MSFDCGLRNISSGAVIASQYFPGEVVYPVMCGTMFQQMLAALFGKVIERMFPREAEDEGDAAPAGSESVSVAGSIEQAAPTR